MPFTINTESVARMAAMIRIKQLAQKSAQDRLIEIIKPALESANDDTSGEASSARINSELAKYLATSTSIREGFLAKQAQYKEEGKNFAEELGYPILFSKTHAQLNMVKTWAEERGEELLRDVTTGKLYHSLPNDIPRNTLPTLQSSSLYSFWGNENASASSVLLASITSSLTPETRPNLTGASTYYHFFNEAFTITLDSPYPFADANGMRLFGDYQFGAHRYFSNSYPNLGQQIFAPEDCSSAVAKATGLTQAQVVGIYTGAIKEAYSNTENQYHYTAVRDGAQAGDIYLRGGHTAIISEVAGTEIDTLGFNRDIDCEAGKQLGGGSYKYNLTDSTEDKPILILRSNQAPLGESSSLPDFLARIDGNYYAKFAELGPLEEIAGDCYDYFNNID